MDDHDLLTALGSDVVYSEARRNHSRIEINLQQASNCYYTGTVHRHAAYSVAMLTC